jgi:hypothetical protein
MNGLKESNSQNITRQKYFCSSWPEAVVRRKQRFVPLLLPNRSLGVSNQQIEVQHELKDSLET